jgi:hypothetical protein
VAVAGTRRRLLKNDSEPLSDTLLVHIVVQQFDHT